MANIMSLKQVRNRPSRNGFDLSTKRNFTAKVGEILPVWWKYVCPGDKFDINLSHFCRTVPVNTAAFARLRQYYDFFFVPIETLWNRAPEVFTQMLNNVQHSGGPDPSDTLALSGQFPYITDEQVAQIMDGTTNIGVSLATSEDLASMNVGFQSCKLLQYLGYGNYTRFLPSDAGGSGTTWTTSPLNQNVQRCIFPLLAYQRIYNDAFRYTQWERAQPWSYNVDYIKGNSSDLNFDLATNVKEANFSNILTLRYCNYQKDMIHGLLPNAQFGSEASIDLDVNFQGSLISDIGVPATSAYPLFIADTSQGSNANKIFWDASHPSSLSDPQNRQNLSTSFSILALRQAEALQRWKEISQAAREDYADQIQAHWGLSVSDYLSHKARYLGGSVSSLDINPVVNNNITGTNSAEIAGLGTVRDNGHITFESKGEYGIIMCVFHALPLLDYTFDYTDPATSFVDATSFPIPEFDKIGMEEVNLGQICNPRGTSNVETFKGYAPRYIYWKTDVDVSFGAFRDSLKSWVIPFDSTQLVQMEQTSEENVNQHFPAVNYSFFKVFPRVVDSLFAVSALENNHSFDSDCFLVSAMFDVKKASNLDVDGLPY